ncbi:hypothetical protein V6N13_075615 [Hibiscus sabdariffa]|uniref:Uncharacterized protein n=1 Tax=Hibiscus sabdariffa TaxID=183260 RepID=A0ABR2UCU1_9ROSI
MAEAQQQFWWRTAWFLGALVPTIISSGLSMELTVRVSSIITGAASLLFLLGNGCYKKESPQRNFRSGMTNWRSLSRLVPVWMAFLIYCLVEAAHKS